MFYQGRGNVHLAEVLNGVVSAYKYHICPDSFTVDLSTTNWKHINKCGPVDVPDATGEKEVSGAVKFSFANVEDKNYALAVLGTVTPQGSPGTVTNEPLPTNIEDGDIWFLGGLTRHRTITGLTIPGLALNTDYTLDAVSGKVTFVGDQPSSPALLANYGYTDPPSVSMLTSTSKEYAVMFENINKQQAGDPGSIELYRVKLGAAQNQNYMSDEAQVFDINGEALADTTKSYNETEFGQFGRRVL